MIKFFRKIRKKLLAEGKTANYLKYAIGEIVLVVIGILIALQINNWNKKTLDLTKQYNYLKNIKRDLEDQIASIDNQIVYETKFIDAASYLVTYFNENSFNNLDQDFFSKLSDLHTRKTFIVNDPTYTDLLSSGNIDLIKNADFKDNLIQYYNELERIEKVIQNNNTYLVDEQFGNKFIDIGYYFSNLENDENSSYVAKVKSLELTSLYNEELSSISKDLLSRPENKLLIMNIINIRHTVSLGNLGNMQDAKQTTQNLLEELNEIMHD